MTLENLTIDEFKIIVKSVVDESIEEHLEDLEALSSKAYVNSIKESRNEIENGEYFDLEELDV
ncbi:hypothetical protein OAQ99_05120 [Candidatus Kapabacteria bacterium]|nr:hypothetical protein [Candidatus Kapabacteria bacterium]